MADTVIEAAYSALNLVGAALPVQLDHWSIPSDSFHGAHMDITTVVSGQVRQIRQQQVPLHDASGNRQVGAAQCVVDVMLRQGGLLLGKALDQFCAV